ncbi:MAG: carbohydrate kinase family protein, partial [Pseudomonadota bacterium]
MAADTRHGIIAGCSWTVDRIKIIESWPQQEHLAQIVSTDQQGGGCGHNLAVDMRKLDSALPVEAIGLVGTDADGRFLQQKVQG